MAQQYIPIRQEEFEETLSKIGTFEEAEDAPGNEVAYDFNVPADDIVVRVFSTIVDGESRGNGEDAIRTVLWHTFHNVPVGGKKKTLRIGPTDSNPHGWKSNLVPKVADLLANWNEYYHGDCHVCGSPMQKREGDYGDFLGCSRYPTCQATREVGEEAKPPREQSENACPECATGELVEREGKYGEFLGCDNFPDCDHTENL